MSMILLLNHSFSLLLDILCFLDDIIRDCTEFSCKIITYLRFNLCYSICVKLVSLIHVWSFLLILYKILILEVLWIVKIDVRLSKLSCNNLDCYQFSFEIRIWYTLMILSSFKWNPEHELFGVILNEFLYERLTNWFFNAANRICLRFLAYVINFISLEFCHATTLWKEIFIIDFFITLIRVLTFWISVQ